MHGPVVPVGVDPLVGQNLDVLPAGSAVQLVGSGQSAAHPVRQPALLRHMLLEVRRRLGRVLSDSKHLRCHIYFYFSAFWKQSVNQMDFLIYCFFCLFFWRCVQWPSEMTFHSDGLFLPAVIFHLFMTSSFFFFFLPSSPPHFSRPPPATCVLTITFMLQLNIFPRCLNCCQSPELPS